MSFTNKVAVITGGAQGMGAAYAQILAQRGVAVAILDINSDKAELVSSEITAGGGRAIAVKVDVGSADSCREAVTQVIEHFGGVDFLVNNAGLLSASTLPPLHQLDAEDYQKVLSVNMHSCLFMTQAVVESMKSRGGGAIVNTSSIGSWMKTGIYSVSKLGVNGLTVNLSQELAPFGIRVNAIAPGTTATEGMQPLMSVEQMSEWGQMLGRPTSEVAGPEHIAKVGVFLLSEEAHYVNGQVIAVDGGTVVRV